MEDEIKWKEENVECKKVVQKECCGDQ